jgi:hypothetical protein
MEEGSIAVLVDAKEEYTKQLVSILKPCIYQGIKSIYLDAKDICMQDNIPDKILMQFQELLSRIPKWSQDIINKEYERILNVSKCDYIEDLLKVIYVSHIKVLTIVHSAQKNKKITVKVPSGSHFIHLCYIEVAREFWKDPYLFSENVSKYELQKNMRDSENMISESITETIRKQLPVRHILKEFLNEPDEDIEEEDEDIKETVNKKYMKKLETVVKKELKTTGNTGSNEIDIDLIRKVIREELATRPETTSIKKELVDTVIEKIVEQSSEPNIDIEEPVIEESKNEKSKKEEPVKEAASVTKDIEPVKEAESAKDIEPVKEAESATKDIEPVKDTEIDTVDEGKMSSNIQDLLEENIMEKTIDNSDTEPELKKEESKSNNTANNIDNIVQTGVQTGFKKNNEMIILDDDEIIIDDEIIEPKKEKAIETAKLAINNIEEINLDLDLEEINDLEELTLSKPQNTQKQSSSSQNPIKKDDTKYIFFNDV